jgi:hypothetical protein
VKIENEKQAALQTTVYRGGKPQRGRRIVLKIFGKFLGGDAHHQSAQSSHYPLDPSIDFTPQFFKRQHPHVAEEEGHRRITASFSSVLILFFFFRFFSFFGFSVGLMEVFRFKNSKRPILSKHRFSHCVSQH